MQFRHWSKTFRVTFTFIETVFNSEWSITLFVNWGVQKENIVAHGNILINNYKFANDCQYVLYILLYASIRSSKTIRKKSLREKIILTSISPVQNIWFRVILYTLTQKENTIDIICVKSCIQFCIFHAITVTSCRLTFCPCCHGDLSSLTSYLKLLTALFAKCTPVTRETGIYHVFLTRLFNSLNRQSIILWCMKKCLAII